MVVPLSLDYALTPEQQREMAAIPATAWFTQVVFRNAQSPVHPQANLLANNDLKQEMTADWIRDSVAGKRVLDLFSANGAFALLAAQAGAREVVGVEFAEDRVACARFLASTLKTDCKIEFRLGDVYRLTDMFSEPFDVVLCLGGLYHVADPAHVLRQVGQLTRERLIVQTSQVLSLPGNWAKFVIRREARVGMTSIRRGYGTWRYTPGCLRQLLHHGGFDIVEERRPPRAKRRRFPWYLALCTVHPD
jgi:tRNA (mo5U34)-methyltransferase